MARVFDLEPLIDPILLGCDKERIHIEGICICHDILFVTTNASIGYTFCGGELLTKKHLGLRKAVQKVEALDESRVLILTSDGILSIVDIDTLTIKTGKQSQLTNVSDFSINKAPVDGNAFDVEVLIAIQKKKAAALLNVTPSNTMLVKSEFSFSESPGMIVCHQSSALIQFSTEYKMLSLSTKSTIPLIGVTEQKAPMTVFAEEDSFILSGPDRLGVFIAVDSGIPNRPPLQLDSTTDFITCIGDKLCAGGGEFLTVYGNDSKSDEEGREIVQLQIIGVPGIKFIEYSNSGKLQICATNDAIYSLTSLPFYTICFHLLSQGALEDSLAELDRHCLTSPGMCEDDVYIWTRKIQIAAGFVAITNGKFDMAKNLFQDSETSFRDIVSTFLRNGLLNNEGLMADDLNSVEEKYSKRVDPEAAKHYFLLNITEELRNSRCPMCAHVYLDQMIRVGNSISLSATIDELTDLGVNLDWSTFTDRIGQKENCQNSLAKILWHMGKYQEALKVFMALENGASLDESFIGSEFLSSFLISRNVSRNIMEILVSSLDEIMATCPDLALKIITKANVDEQVIFKKIKKSRQMKIKYLEFLVEQGNTKKFIFDELVKEYVKSSDFESLRKLTSNPVIWTVLKAEKFLEMNFGNSAHGVVVKCEVYHQLGRLPEIFSQLITEGYSNELEEFCFRKGSLSLTQLAIMLMKTANDLSRPFLAKYGKYLDGCMIISELPHDAPISAYADLLRALSAASSLRMRAKTTERALKVETLLNILGEYDTMNFKKDRSESNWRSHQCQVTGRVITDDFYMFPSGYICLPSAAASPFVCPLTGKMLTSFPHIHATDN